jgi:hypothetical protein
MGRYGDGRNLEGRLPARCACVRDCEAAAFCDRLFHLVMSLLMASGSSVARRCLGRPWRDARGTTLPRHGKSSRFPVGEPEPLPGAG